VDITGRLGGCQRWCRRFTRRRDREVTESALRLADHAVFMLGPGRSEVAGPHPALRARGSSSALVSWQGCREQGYGWRPGGARRGRSEPDAGSV